MILKKQLLYTPNYVLSLNPTINAHATPFLHPLIDPVNVEMSHGHNRAMSLNMRRYPGEWNNTQCQGPLWLFDYDKLFDASCSLAKSKSWSCFILRELPSPQTPGRVRPRSQDDLALSLSLPTCIYIYIYIYMYIDIHLLLLVLLLLLLLLLLLVSLLLLLLLLVSILIITTTKARTRTTTR